MSARLSPLKNVQIQTQLNEFPEIGQGRLAEVSNHPQKNTLPVMAFKRNISSQARASVKMYHMLYKKTVGVFSVAVDVLIKCLTIGLCAA